MPMPQISLTKLVIDDMVTKLKEQVGNTLAVEYYPEKPASYRLNHANGALLVNYARSNYPKHDDTFAVIRPREQVFTVTIVTRNLHDRYGAVPIVDWVLAMLSGHTPVNCTKPLYPVKDYFDNHEAGLWFYGVDFATELVLVQSLPVMEV